MRSVTWHAALSLVPHSRLSVPITKESSPEAAVTQTLKVARIKPVTCLAIDLSPQSRLGVAHTNSIFQLQFNPKR